jgi:UDP-N-acetylglucosamine transferase subunit ALG13
LILVGTDHHPFGRAVAWADARQQAHPEDHVLVQHGRSDPPARAQGRAFLTAEELRREVTQADVVITHGGPGTISDARSAGHRPIVFPRDPTLGEHVDDHQRRFAPWCAERGLVLLAMDTAQLDRQVAALPADGTRLDGPVEGLGTEAVERFAEVVSAPWPHRAAPAAPGAPKVLQLVGPASAARAVEARLASRPGTLVMGYLVRDWPRGADGSAQCGCGLGFGSCPFWGEVGRRAFGGWDEVDVERVRGLREQLAGPGAARAARRHPGRAARGRLLEFAAVHRSVLEAARDVGSASLLVIRGAPAVALALSHDRHVDLQVADLGVGRGPRWAMKHRRLVVHRWPEGVPPDPKVVTRHLQEWAPATPGFGAHSPVVAVQPVATAEP